MIIFPKVNLKKSTRSVKFNHKQPDGAKLKDYNYNLVSAYSKKPFIEITAIIAIISLSYKTSLDVNYLVIHLLFYLHDAHVCVVQLSQVTFPKAVLPTAGPGMSESGCKGRISRELISQNTRRTQLTPCKAFWANTEEQHSHF